MHSLEKDDGRLFLSLSADETLTLWGLACPVFPQESSEIADHLPTEII